MKLGLFVTLTLFTNAIAYKGGMGDGIDAVLYRALERIRGKFAESYTFPDIPTIDIYDKDVSLHLKLKSSTISNTNFTIDFVKSHLVFLWSKYRVTAPIAEVSGYYKIHGTAFNRNVMGSGHFKVRIVNLVNTGFVQMRVENSSYVIDFMRMDYSLDSFTHNITGLTVDGDEGEAADAFLDHKLWPWLVAKKKTVCHHVAESFREVGNKVIDGKSLIEIVYMLKTFSRNF